MPSLLANSPLPETLEQVLGETGEQEYRRLLRVARMSKGRFALLPIESDLSSSYRTLFLSRLQEELAEQGQCLRAITLTRDNWQLLALPEMETPFNSNEVAMLIGLEETPHFESSSRPPIFALLNILRESLRNHIPAAFFIWCSPYAYDALMKHAPDLFDHASGIFHFLSNQTEGGKHIVESVQARLGVSISMQEEYIPFKAPDVAPSSPPSPTMVAFYRNILASRNEGTTEYASSQIDLAGSLLRINSSHNEKQFSEAFDLLDKAMIFLSSKVGEDSSIEIGRRWLEPIELARGLSLKGSGLYQLHSGDHEVNIRSAIQCYEKALNIYTEEMFPKEWAITQNNLGLAYSTLPSGDRAANLLSAIRCFEASLRVCTEQTFPTNWAATQNNLGNVYSILPSGDHEANLCLAITHYEAALRVRTEHMFPNDWAATQNNLGNVYLYLEAGDKDTNLRYAIRCYEAALQVRTEQAYPEQWAMTQLNLGVAYSELHSGDKDSNLRIAIKCFEAAMTFRTKRAFPQDWAAAQNNLGTVYSELLSGDRDANVCHAIRCFESALKIRTEEAFPYDWAMSQNNLGTAYSRLQSGVRDGNLNTAIRFYEASLKVRTEKMFPKEWATTQFNMGSIFLEMKEYAKAVWCYQNYVRGYIAVGLNPSLEQLEFAEHKLQELSYP